MIVRMTRSSEEWGDKILGLGIVLLTSFLVSFVVGVLVMGAEGTGAVESGVNSGANISVGTILNFAAEPEVRLALTPSPDGAQSSNNMTLTVGTNSKTGYRVTMHALGETIGGSEPGTSLLHDNGVAAIRSTTNVELGALGNNMWGYNVGAGTSGFLAIPDLTTPATIKTVDVPILGDQTVVNFGAKADTTIPAGNYANTMVFTVTADFEPKSPEEFRFTINTRMDEDGGQTGDGTSYVIPTRGLVGTERLSLLDDEPEPVIPEHTYGWEVDCGGGAGGMIVTGASSQDSAGILCEYDDPGIYQIAISPVGEAYEGWMDAYGAGIDAAVGGPDPSAMYVVSIDTPLTNNMRTPGATYRFATMFAGLVSLENIPEELFENISTAGDDDLTGMFMLTFASSGTLSSDSNFVPSELFSPIDTTGATVLDNMLSGTFLLGGSILTPSILPDGLFSFLDTSSADSVSGMLAATFGLFGLAALMFPDGAFAISADINAIWGDADLSAITASNAADALGSTFLGATTVSGDAGLFIQNKLGGIIPDEYAGTFDSSSVFNVPHPNWGAPLTP